MRRWVVSTLAGLTAVVVAACGGLQPSRSASSTQPSATKSTPQTSTASTNSATPPSSPGDDWPTYHRRSTRTGSARVGPALGQVRRLWTSDVDGAVYAEPVVAAGKVVVATENNSVYAFDEASGRRLWRTHLATPVPGGDLLCGNIDPSGITGTPVIDVGSRIVFAVTFQRFEHRLVALDLGSGSVRWQRAIDPPGADHRTHQQRAALALSHSRVYVAYGGLYGDCGEYHGWVLGAPAAGPTGAVLGYEVPTQREGAIWAPSGPAVDGAGNLYVATGNGASTSSFDFGNSVVRLTPQLRVSGYFAPSNAPTLSGSDLDLGSTGPILLPDSRTLIIGKTGVGYLLSTRNLGSIGHALSERSICGAAFGGNAYAHGTIYVPCTDGIAALHLSGNQLQPLWKQTAATFPPIVAGPGVWAIGGSWLYQLGPEAGKVRFSAPIGEPAHFATPAASGGRVFAAAGGHVYAFG